MANIPLGPRRLKLIAAVAAVLELYHPRPHPLLDDLGLDMGSELARGS
jgi:hypothetical protein